MKYRLYIDEVGNSDLGASEDRNHRYLTLIGLILELGYVAERLAPQLEALKHRYFASHPDEPVILHRKELVNRRVPFAALRDPKVEERFNAELLALLGRLECAILAVTIDKLEHRWRYTTWRFDPYHYCLQILIERYVMWLGRRKATGDVLAESRGGKEDRRLKDSFERLCKDGTGFVEVEDILQRLTSRQLKVKTKTNNIAGLQLADVIAHPISRRMIAVREGTPVPDNFGGRIYQAVQPMIDRRSNGQVEGWGLKWLP